jgi:hypothetical protein
LAAFAPVVSEKNNEMSKANRHSEIAYYSQQTQTTLTVMKIPHIGIWSRFTDKISQQEN